MPVSTAARASTADNTGGTQVAQSTNEVATGPILQSVVVEGNKTSYAEASRTGLTAADSATDLSTAGFAGSAGANLCDLGNALAVAVRATCSAAAAALTGRLALYDGSNNPIALSEVITLTTDATRRVSASGDYLAPRVLVDAGQARKARFYVESLSAGTWAVYARPV
jgi:hypothetical protein